MSDHDLIWEEFSNLKREEIYVYARDVARIRGLSNSTKDEMLARVRAELSKPGGLGSWEQLTRFVAQRGALGKQHVFLYDVDPKVSRDWSDPDEVEQRLLAAGYDVLGIDEAAGAPEELTLASVKHEDGILRITAAGRRTVQRRDNAAEERLSQEVGEGKVVRVLETVAVRAWIVFEWNTTASTAELRVGQLNRDSDYNEIVLEFFALVPWLPNQQLRPIDLADVVRRLHVQAEAEQLGGAKGETTLQGTDYLTGALRSENRSRKARQPMLDDDAEVVDAMRLLRKHGIAGRGNCHWRKKGDGGTDEAVVLKTPLHTDIAAAKGRVKIMRPVTPDELRFLLRRLRALA